MSRLPVALVGLGPASEPHLRALADLSDRVEVVVAATRSPGRAAAFVARTGLPVSTDVDAALTDPRARAVILLTPPAAHLEPGLRALGAGKHLLVEKPLDLTAARGAELVAAARAAGVRLGVVLQHRFRPGALRLAAALRDGRLGRVEAASMTVPWWRPQAYYDEPGRGTLARDGGGVLLTQAIHTLDLFRSLVGVASVTAATATTTGLHAMGTEDHVAALVRLRDGGPGVIQATTAAYPGGPERIEVIGTNGTGSLVGGALRLAFLDGTEETVEAEGGTGGGASIMDFPHDAHRALLADFIAAVAEGRDPAVTGAEALASQELVEMILAAARGNRA